MRSFEFMRYARPWIVGNRSVEVRFEPTPMTGGDWAFLAVYENGVRRGALGRIGGKWVIARAIGYEEQPSFEDALGTVVYGSSWWFIRPTALVM